MILYYSGRVLLYTKPKKGITQRPEDLLKNGSVMFSYAYIKRFKTQDFKRFKNIIKSRRKEKENAKSK